MSKKLQTSASIPMVSLALSGIFLLFAIAVFSVVASQVSSSRSAVMDASLSLASKRAQQQELEQAVRMANETKIQRAALMGLIIPQGGSGAFIASVEALGHTAGVAPSVFSVNAQGPQGGTPGALDLSVQFTGGYADCLRFVRLVETMPFSVAVSSLSLQYNSTAGVWNGTLELSALSYDLP